VTPISPSPANAQVSRALCIGLTSTSANVCFASTGRICSASRRPLSVKGMSVVPVCCPLRLHTVSPCLIAKTFTLVSSTIRRCRPQSNARPRKPLPVPTSSR
jgi:hypothetical protein